jgi:hypothetical protein
MRIIKESRSLLPSCNRNPVLRSWIVLARAFRGHSLAGERRTILLHSCNRNPVLRSWIDLPAQGQGQVYLCRVKAKLRKGRRNATRPNETRAINFVHDQLAADRTLRVLAIVDF